MRGRVCECECVQAHVCAQVWTTRVRVRVCAGVREQRHADACALAAAWCRAKSATHRTYPCAQRTHTRIVRRTSTLARGRRTPPPRLASARAHTLSPHPFLASCSATHAHSPGSVAMAKASPPASSSAASTSGPAASSGSPGSEHAPPRAPPARERARASASCGEGVCAGGCLRVSSQVCQGAHARTRAHAHAHAYRLLRSARRARLHPRAMGRLRGTSTPSTRARRRPPRRRRGLARAAAESDACSWAAHAS